MAKQPTVLDVLKFADEAKRDEVRTASILYAESLARCPLFSPSTNRKRPREPTPYPCNDFSDPRIEPVEFLEELGDIMGDTCPDEPTLEITQSAYSAEEDEEEVTRSYHKYQEMGESIFNKSQADAHEMMEHSDYVRSMLVGKDGPMPRSYANYALARFRLVMFRQFLEECTVIDKEAQIDKSELYRHFNQWSMWRLRLTLGHPPHLRFGKALKAAMKDAHAIDTSNHGADRIEGIRYDPNKMARQVRSDHSNPVWRLTVH